MMRSRIFLASLAVATLLLGLLVVRPGVDGTLTARRQLVHQLGLTDLSIWSEARYTRHPSQADYFTAFQDYPGAIEHFPAGSIVGPGQPTGRRLEVRKLERR